MGFVGFTLAEVLITLGIIGIVAALTIPNLASNIRGRQNAIKFKKALSTLSNAARMSKYKYEFDFSDLNTMCSQNSGSANPEIMHSICAMFNGTLKGASYYYNLDELKNQKGEPYRVYYVARSLGGKASFFRDGKYNNPTYQLSDGTILILSRSIGSYPCTREIGKTVHSAAFYETSTGGSSGSACYGYIDVNGTSGPNQEIKCDTGNIIGRVTGNTPDCTIKTEDITDVFPVIFYDSIVEPYSDAGWVVLNSVK